MKDKKRRDDLRGLDDRALAALVDGLRRRSRNDQSNLHAAEAEQRRRRKEKQHG